MQIEPIRIPFRARYTHSGLVDGEQGNRASRHRTKAKTDTARALRKRQRQRWKAQVLEID